MNPIAPVADTPRFDKADVERAILLSKYFAGADVDVPSVEAVAWLNDWADRMSRLQSAPTGVPPEQPAPSPLLVDPRRKEIEDAAAVVGDENWRLRDMLRKLGSSTLNYLTALENGITLDESTHAALAHMADLYGFHTDAALAEYTEEPDFDF